MIKEKYNIYYNNKKVKIYHTFNSKIPKLIQYIYYKTTKGKTSVLSLVEDLRSEKDV